MIKKAIKYFNTSGPNILEEHYTLMREKLIEIGMDMVKNDRYFTIWAPRQTGKSTYFRMLAEKLKVKNYKVSHINLENYKNAKIKNLFDYLLRKLLKDWAINIESENFEEFQNNIEKIQNKKCILIIDEIEGLNPELFNQFLHTIRNLYHSRKEHCLKCVILVGVSNIVGIIQDNASPFNIADNLEVPYFTKEEVFALLSQHEKETEQLFENKAKEKIYSITSGQPGLVNGLAYKLVEKNPEKEILNYKDYLKVEDWYLTETIDKNISNIINQAKKYRNLIEKLLFRENKIKYDIGRESIKFLHSHGIIKKSKDGNIEFWVLLYKKKLYSSFYPYLNGESSIFFRYVDLDDFFKEDNKINFDLLIDNYKNYIKRRSFKAFREKDEKTGKYKQIKEAAIVYSFESYINNFLTIIEAKSYLEPHSGLGRSDLIVNYKGDEYVIEVKIYRDSFQYKKGKKQLAYYCNSINIKEGIYLIFVSNEVKYPKEGIEKINNVKIRTYLIKYDEKKDF